ncbi:AAA family ATPase [Amnibacterium sp. CER49]|uniref:ATP-dependent nuclease n=1 Tax=Amnibacterium sp. CER49 TaxID=3039161 RepID=UPI00244A71FC|nr:AAA family ATPase [Amnibacterium sp. CER49]MDH2442556.1 AAA family ATPase [Amnibacterium sp. CER49]
MTAAQSSLTPVTVSRAEVFGLRPGDSNEPVLTIDDWSPPVQFFIGRNGSGKSRTARAIRSQLNGRLLSTDRLTGLMSFVNYGWGSVPTAFKGVPLGDEERQQMQQMQQTGTAGGEASDELYALREQPEVWLRVAAFVRRTLGRVLDLRESAGFLDPYVRIDDVEYSLLRDEGHGLRELVVLLTAIYRADTRLLVIDEPELHLHPAMARMWLTELNRECARTGKRAIIVTHEPSFIRPRSFDDLKAIWLFAPGRLPMRVSEGVLDVQEISVTASVLQNPQLVAQLAFAPRPVLLEGSTDVAAFTTALTRLVEPAVVAQTELIDCGGSGSVGVWLEICTKLGVDVKAIADLDALFDNGVQRAVNQLPALERDLVAAFASEPGQLQHVLQPVTREANRAGIPSDPASRADWLRQQSDPESAVVLRRDRIIDILRLHGLWLHMGNLEQVLNISTKGVVQATAAAAQPSGIDEAALWAAYELDLHGDVEVLLNVAVERVAHAIMLAERAGPATEFRTPVGGSAVADARLVRVEPIEPGRHRITVLTPEPFVGYWLEFTRATPSTELQLRPPTASAASEPSQHKSIDN